MSKIMPEMPKYPPPHNFFHMKKKKINFINFYCEFMLMKKKKKHLQPPASCVLIIKFHECGGAPVRYDQPPDDLVVCNCGVFPFLTLLKCFKTFRSNGAREINIVFLFKC